MFVLRRRPLAGAAVRIALLLAWTTLSALGACGGGGGGGERETPFSIVTTTLPSGGLTIPYSADLEATGGLAPYSWTLDTGSALPPGLSLAGDGAISGTPTATGSFTFSVTVTDASSPARTDTAAYGIDVASFSASVGSLHWGDAWSQESYPLTSTGGSVTFSLVVNASGGTITGANPPAGTATYTAGSGTGTDRIRATSGGGGTVEMDVVVRANPVANMTARFSTTDVWYLRFDGKRGSHLFACDFDQSLAAVGLRAPSSTDATGTTADQIARAWIRKRVIAYMNSYYLNAEDGTPQGGGLDVSFPFDEPLPPHTKPSAGTVLAAAYNQFNVISFLHGTADGVLGTAYLDDPDNGWQENDTSTSSAGDLGVFTDEISTYFNFTYDNAVLLGQPVSSSDVARLKSLFYATATSGDSRWQEIRRIGEGYARTLAAVGAHEVGHSLSLTHTVPSQSGSIMNASAVISPSASYSFISGDVSDLQTALPGPNRGGVPARLKPLDGFDVPEVYEIPGHEGILPRVPCTGGKCVLRVKR